MPEPHLSQLPLQYQLRQLHCHYVHPRLQGVNGDRQVTFDQTRGVTTYSWSEDGGSILYLQDNNGDENDHLYIVLLNVTGQPKAIDLTPFKGVKAAGRDCLWTASHYLCMHAIPCQWHSYCFFPVNYLLVHDSPEDWRSVSALI